MNYTMGEDLKHPFNEWEDTKDTRNVLKSLGNDDFLAVECPCKLFSFQFLLLLLLFLVLIKVGGYERC